MAGAVAKAYSDALFQVGVEENCLDKLCDEIDGLAKIAESTPELIKLFTAPTISVKEKNDSAERIFGESLSGYAMNFIRVLIEKNRFGYIGKISEELRKSYNEYSGIVEVTVTTATPLSDALRTKLVEKLTTVTGKKISLVEKVDESIIGGIVLSYGNTQMDSSIRSRIDGIHAQIKSVIA